jgi:hypothetical protein
MEWLVWTVAAVAALYLTFRYLTFRLSFIFCFESQRLNKHWKTSRLWLRPSEERAR